MSSWSEALEEGAEEWAATEMRAGISKSNTDCIVYFISKSMCRDADIERDIWTRDRNKYVRARDLLRGRQG